jgi:hypothetical protein
MRTALKLDADRLLKLELSFDPVKKRASLAMNGRMVLDGYSGTSEYLEVPGLGIAFGASQSRIGEGVFGDIRFLMD